MEETPVPQYLCSVCGQAVILIADEVIRACEHQEAGVVANMQAHAVGIGSLQEDE